MLGELYVYGKKGKKKLNFGIIIVLVFTSTSNVVSYAYPPVVTLDGFAEGTTGGGGTTPKVVKLVSEFRNAVKDNSEAVIIVQGRINLGGSVSIGSNKTIIGADSKSGVYLYVSEHTVYTTRPGQF